MRLILPFAVAFAIAVASANLLQHEWWDCWGSCGKGGDCDWCGTQGKCCRKWSEEGTCDGSQGGDGYHACIWSPLVQNQGTDCWDSCNSQGGDCDYCGTQGKCCRKGYEEGTCDGTLGGEESHTCVLTGCFLYGVDFVGNDIQDVVSNSPSDCQEACSTEPTCNVWTFSPSEQKCWLKTTVGNNIIPQVDRISGPKTRDGVFILDGIDFYGNDIRDVVSDSPSVCQEACSTEPTCNVWTYSASLQKCWLKTNVGNTINQDSDRKSGPKSCDDCNCNVNGSEGTSCNENGQCTCKPNFVGKRCDSCKANFGGNNCDSCSPGYFEFPDCKDCQCNVDGSENTSCNENGQCTCKANVAGDKCDSCSPGYFEFPACKDCKCNVDGSDNNSCNENGQCTCKAYVVGDKCDSCSAGDFPNCQVPSCPVGWESYGSKCYYINEGVDSDTADELCASKGGKVFLPTNADEESAVTKMFGGGTASVICERYSLLAIPSDEWITAPIDDNVKYLMVTGTEFGSNSAKEYCESLDATLFVAGSINEESFVGVLEGQDFACKKGTFGNKDLSLKETYCAMSLSQKRNLLESDWVSGEEVETLLASVRACTSGTVASCKHTAEEVLDYPGETLLKEKISEGCDDICNGLKESADKDFDKIKEQAVKILDNEGKIAQTTLSKYETVTKKLGEIAKATVGTVTDVTGKIQNIMKAAGLDQSEQNFLTTITDNEALKDTTRLISNVMSKTVMKSSNVKKILKQIGGRKKSVLASITKTSSTLKKYATGKNVAKGVQVAANLALGLSTIVSGTSSNGTVDYAAIISSGLVIADTIAMFLPPPASMITGTASTIMGMFSGGGGPSAEQQMVDQFEEQKQFIEEQFSEHERVMKEFITRDGEATRNLISATEIETVKAKALGVLDAIDFREIFIMTYEDIGTCLDESVINEITQRVQYFMDLDDAASIKHAFDYFCPRVLEKAEKSSIQVACGFMLHTYMVIEDKRNQILIQMLNLLANTEQFEELSYGYLSVQEHQKEMMESWIEETLRDSSTFCGLFGDYSDIWSGHQEQRDETIRLINHAAPSFQKSPPSCRKTDCTMSGYEYGHENLETLNDVGNAEDCQLKCYQYSNNTCTYWSYDTSSHICNLKEERGNIKRNSHIQSGPKACPTKSELEESVNSVGYARGGSFTNVIDGFKDHINHVPDIETCYVICRDRVMMENCRVYTYDTTNRECHLYGADTTRWDLDTFGFESDSTLDKVSGPGIFFDSHTDNIDFWQTPITTTEVNESDGFACQKACFETSGCEYWVIWRGATKCFMHGPIENGAMVKVTEGSTIAGPKIGLEYHDLALEMRVRPLPGCAEPGKFGRWKDDRYKWIGNVGNAELCYYMCKEDIYDIKCKVYSWNAAGDFCELFGLDDHRWNWDRYDFGWSKTDYSEKRVSGAIDGSCPKSTGGNCAGFWCMG